MIGAKKLNAIGSEDVQQVKARLGDKAPKTVDNVLTVLNTLLKKALEWDVIERMPCAIRLLRTPKPTASFHEFEAYETLVKAAEGSTAGTFSCTGGDADAAAR